METRKLIGYGILLALALGVAILELLRRRRIKKRGY
jgi:hypothetical protein